MRKVVLGALILLAGCGGDKNADRQLLQQQGYTNIQLNGWVPFVCGSEDNFSDSFTAISTNGTRINGTVCGGWFKGRTIRF